MDENALENAVHRGDVLAVRQALRNGADANQLRSSDVWRRTLLHLACERGHAQVARVLVLEANADVHATDRAKRTALVYAVTGDSNEESRAEIVQLLLDSNVNLNAVARIGNTALHSAKSARVAQLLLDAGADLRIVDTNGDSPLHDACKSGRLEVVEVLLNASGGDELVHQENKDGERPLHLAVKTGDNNLVRLLHSFKANANESSAGQNPPVFEALHHNVPTEVLRYLVEEMNASLDARTNKGASLLHCAENVEAMRYLIERGADIEAVNDGMPLGLWAFRLRLDLVRELTTAGADLTSTNIFGRTAFDGANIQINSPGGVAPETVTPVTHHLLEEYHSRLVRTEAQLSLHWIFQHATYFYFTGRFGGFVHSPLNHLRVQLSLGKLTMNDVWTFLQLFDTSSMIRRLNDSGAVPLHIACQKGAPFEILRMLLQLDESVPRVADGAGLATPRCRDHQGALPIHELLSSRPAVGSVKLLLEAYPTSASVRKMNGDYPLMVACESSASVDVIFELLKAYPDLVGR